MIEQEPSLISYNSFQLSALLLEAKIKVLVAGRGTGKSFINGSEIDENVRMMPRGITANVQKTLGQALTKTLPSAFKLLESLGYKRWDAKTKTGDYVICRQPPNSFYTPFEKLMSYEYVISFSNGHAIYILSQEAGARGPNVDYMLVDEALAIDKTNYNQEASATNRGNEENFGFLAPKEFRCLKHHGMTFTSSMPYTQEQRWLTDYGKYYIEEKGVRIFDIWNRIVNLQLECIKARMNGDKVASIEAYKESLRLRRTMTPFVSKDGVLFMLSNSFDNISNLGFDYIINQFKSMDLMSFMIEMLNYYVERVSNCYYSIDERHVYYDADNSDFIRGTADNNDFDWDKLSKRDCRFDADCNMMKPLEICADWGSKISLIEVGQESDFDFVTKRKDVKCDNTINEFYVKPSDDTDDTMINSLMDMFSDYYRFHATREVIYVVDTYGDIRLANSKKTYNEHAIARLKQDGWKVTVKRHPGKEPPQNKKYLLWQYLLKETDQRLPKKRFNGTNCKKLLISMNNTESFDDKKGNIFKDKRSEGRKNVLPEEATHFGDAADKRMWTKYGYLLDNSRAMFVAPRI